MNTNTKRISNLVIAALCLLQTNAQTSSLAKADSLFFALDWTNAQHAYNIVLKDTSHNGVAWNRLGFSEYNLGHYDAALKSFKKALLYAPGPGLKASVYSRMAKLHSVQGSSNDALTDLDSAIANGYINLTEMDTLQAFSLLRNNEHFKQSRQRAYLSANPCMGDAPSRQFDFWVGEWNVYLAGTTTLVGHSLIQMVSGGCALLENWDALGGASNGKSLNFVDPATHKWRQNWIGSYTNGAQDFINGEYIDKAMRFTFTTTDAQGHKLDGRFIFYNEGADQVRQLSETSADEGKTWTTVYNFSYRRIKK